MLFEEELENKTVDHSQIIYFWGEASTYKTTAVYTVFDEMLNLGVYQKPGGLKEANFEGFDPQSQKVLFIDDVNCTA